jgi:hypothetical protein
MTDQPTTVCDRCGATVPARLVRPATLTRAGDFVPAILKALPHDRPARLVEALGGPARCGPLTTGNRP